MIDCQSYFDNKNSESVLSLVNVLGYRTVIVYLGFEINWYGQQCNKPSMYTLTKQLIESFSRTSFEAT